ncbi:PREDICTED: uncharacterized protein LOC108778236 [Cyphomyrmex costatus]|uniref:Uncharacterized protein n=1 Tax=Cyphomyrmex costatus TaxID=456900 RepID=A0A151IC47_9HYME|nr:PREDICTED: uncharacterized protein LOC108778236 [Cyphomyrmex costatus]KYM97656.1 hypothetical protein ALC62_11647 [Cyphomyrmex costatus]
MINLPCNAASMSQVTPCQNVPVQTSQYNFPTCQQRQTSTQQMQTAACGPCSGTSQGGPVTHVCQPDTYIVTHQCAPGTPQPITNPCHPVFQSLPPTHPGCGQLPQNILDQIRACISNTAPIFILPSNYQLSPASQQQQQQQPSMPPLPPQITSSPPAGHPPGGLTYPAACYPSPPPFYPYPMPLPFYDPFIRTREVLSNCGCCQRGQRGDVDSTEIRNVLRAGCRYDATDQAEHRCTPNVDDTICSQRNCPASLHLQALASQFLSLQGIIPCAATRLVLRKVPGSNVTTTMEDTMAKAQKAISALTKDQLLTESKNAQQVNTLINLHMTANPPPNIIPILTLVQLKMNLLKAQVEGLVNQKIMEIQGVGVEVMTDLIDPTVLALKSDAELRDFLSALRQKECDERVNVNFAPYRSQRAIAETRLSNVQNKIRQVEAEFDRRRCAMLPAPTLSSRVLQQFSRPCYSARFEDPRKLYSTVPPDIRSPDPFAYGKPRSPKRLLLKPCTSKAETVPAAGTRGNPPKNPDDDRAKERPATSVQQRRSSTENCACRDRTTSEESIEEDKKKLRARIIEIDAATTVSNVEGLEQAWMKPTSNVCARIDTEGYEAAARTYGERNEIPCGAQCWTAKAYINVTDDESVKTLTESESDTVTLGGKINVEDVCEARDAVEIRSCGQTTNQQEFASTPNVQQYEKQTDDKITVSGRDEIVEERGDIRDVLPPEAVQEVARTAAATRVANEEPISSMQETEAKSLDGIRTSLLNIILKSEKEWHGQEDKDGGGILPSTADAAIERSASQVPTSKAKKKIKFHIVSLMTNIEYDKNLEFERKRKMEKKIAINDKVNIITDPDIEISSDRRSIESLPRSVVAHNITAAKDRSENRFPMGTDLPKLCFDHQCQTTFKEDKTTAVPLLEANAFPPFKNLHKRVTDNEKNGGNVGTYSSLITKAGITTTERLSRCNDVAGSTLETLSTNNVPYRSNVERKRSLILKLFSIIGNRMNAFINKIIETITGRLLYVIRVYASAIFRKNNFLRRDVSISNPNLISKDYDSFAGTSRYSSGLNCKTSKIYNKYDFHDSNLLRISTKEESNGIRKIKHSIIEDKKNDRRYLLIGTSSHNRDLILTRDLGRPYKVQRSLLIRSRLKNSLNSQDYPYPFSLLKRTEENVLPRQAQRNENTEMIKENKIHQLKNSEKFWTLSEIVKINETNGKLLEPREHESEEQILSEHLHDMKNNVSTVQKHTVVDNTAISSELVINVHNYLELQTEINKNIYENHSACLSISNN